ncbi:sigma-54 interaction domain-containing protein [Gudongella sp. DL1XJH-153]|uniref:sigma-54 interaction domain-containing protein n=1 Tax=Gudongella sp. DL1XJH-153 TaxID=3409804 RepID=UPI003BB631A2
MDLKTVGIILEILAPISMIADKNGDILWKSTSMEGLISSGLKSITEILGVNIDKLRMISDKVEMNVVMDKNNYLALLFKTESMYIIELRELGDYNDPEVKAESLLQVVENLYDGVLLSDKNGRVMIYNKAMEELEKRKAEDMIGKFIWDAYGYSDKNKSEHMEVLESGKAIINKYAAHAYNKGKPVYKSYSTIPIKHGESTIGVFSISKDETKLQNLLTQIMELKKESYGLEEREGTFLNGTRFTFTDIIGSSDAIRRVIREAQAIAWLDNSILLVGDTGTGKEVFAQSIHNFSKRKAHPFIGINCSAIPENLLESILFGAVKGAYTGAVDSPGLFEEAGEGTLFLDEIDSMPINMQTKLLRVLQERNTRRVGGKDSYPIKCRIISAMNTDPYKLIDAEKLRLDLFYRIAGYNLYIPPLKDRGDDIFHISHHYIKRYNLLMEKIISSIGEDLKNMMKSYLWPGNIRELEHFIENTMVRSGDDEKILKLENTPDYILEAMKWSDSNKDRREIATENLQNSLDGLEKRLVSGALEKNLWNVTKTAKALGITRQSLIYRMRKYDISRKYEID